MTLNSNNSGKYVSTDWHNKRQQILHDKDMRDSLTAWDKLYYDVEDIQIGSLDPDNFKLTDRQKRDRGM